MWVARRVLSTSRCSTPSECARARRSQDTRPPVRHHQSSYPHRPAAHCHPCERRAGLWPRGCSRAVGRGSCDIHVPTTVRPLSGRTSSDLYRCVRHIRAPSSGKPDTCRYPVSYPLIPRAFRRCYTGSAPLLSASRRSHLQRPAAYRAAALRGFSVP